MEYWIGGVGVWEESSLFDKDFWSGLVAPRLADGYPLLPCPFCRSKTLGLNPDDLTFRNVSADDCAKLFRKHGAMKPDNVRSSFEENAFLGLLAGISLAMEYSRTQWSRFAGFFTCKNCGNSVSTIGLAATPTGKGIGDYERPRIKVEFFSPAVQMFELSSTTPNAINEELLKAFAYFHSDLTAAGAKLRRAAEQFCTELGYEGGSLHNRIRDLGISYPTEADWLRSLKLLGNEATHADGVDEVDLLHAFEVFDGLLDIFRRKEAQTRIGEAVVHLETKFSKP